MENNIFYSKENKKDEDLKNKKFDFKSKKENTLNSLNEVEHFLHDYKHFSKYIKMYRWFKN